MRSILITGGSGKFGRIFVNHFLMAGSRVIATCRTNDSLNDLSRSYSNYHNQFVVIKVDLIKPYAIRALVDELDQKGLKPDCLINNARNIDYLSIDGSGLIGRENFANEYLLDVIVPYELTMALSSQTDTQLRKVVNIGSQYGSVAANPSLYDDFEKQSPLHYSVAKAALAHLTRELAVRLAIKKIQVNCVAFGGVEGRVDDEFKQRYAKLCPMGRMLGEDEIAGPVEMLLSDKCSGVSGHVLAVDGGWGIW